MPIFAFECLDPDCAHTFEELMDSHASEFPKCPKCGSVKVQRVLTVPGGYKIKGSNSSSSRPKDSGSFRRGK
jgi:putative FmdB family regulatory protein